MRTDMCAARSPATASKFDRVRSENARILDKISLTERLGFPEILQPDVERNDMYITIVAGEFQSGRRFISQNIECIMSVVTTTNVELPVIFLGSSAQPCSVYKTPIIYHSNSPCWQETVRLKMPKKDLEQSHLRFTFRHVSSSAEKEKMDKQDRFFAFAFMPLVTADMTVVGGTVPALSLTPRCVAAARSERPHTHGAATDNEHALPVYKFDQRITTSTNYLTVRAREPRLMRAWRV